MVNQDHLHSVIQCIFGGVALVFPIFFLHRKDHARGDILGKSVPKCPPPNPPKSEKIEKSVQKKGEKIDRHNFSQRVDESPVR